MADLEPIAATVLKFVLGIGGTIISALIMRALHSFAERHKVHVSSGMDQIVHDAVNKGVSYANAWASQQANRPAQNQKVAAALQVVHSILENPVIQEYGHDLLEKLVHGALNDSEKPAPQPILLNVNSAPVALTPAIPPSTLPVI